MFRPGSADDVRMPDDDASVPPTPPPPSPAVPPPSGVAGVGTGTVGQPRSSGLTILLFIVTCGIWGFLWNYWVFEENKKWSGEGIGGVVALIIWFFVAPVNFFILPHEVKQMYEADGRESPVSAIWGLWFLLPLIGLIIWLVKVQGAINDFWESKGAAPA